MALAVVVLAVAVAGEILVAGAVVVVVQVAVLVPAALLVPAADVLVPVAVLSAAGLGSDQLVLASVVVELAVVRAAAEEQGLVVVVSGLE